MARKSRSRKRQRTASPAPSTDTDNEQAPPAPATNNAINAGTPEVAPTEKQGTASKEAAFNKRYKPEVNSNEKILGTSTLDLSLGLPTNTFLYV